MEWDIHNVDVKFDIRTGIKVHDILQTTNPKIYAACDVCPKYKSTYAADFMVRIITGNTLFWGVEKRVL